MRCFKKFYPFYKLEGVTKENIEELVKESFYYEDEEFGVMKQQTENPNDLAHQRFNKFKTIALLEEVTKNKLIEKISEYTMSSLYGYVNFNYSNPSARKYTVLEMLFDREKFKEDLYQFFNCHMVIGETYDKIAETYDIESGKELFDNDLLEMTDELGFENTSMGMVQRKFADLTVNLLEDLSMFELYVLFQYLASREAWDRFTPQNFKDDPHLRELFEEQEVAPTVW